MKKLLFLLFSLLPSMYLLGIDEETIRERHEVTSQSPLEFNVTYSPNYIKEKLIELQNKLKDSLNNSKKVTIRYVTSSTINVKDLSTKLELSEIELLPPYGNYFHFSLYPYLYSGYSIFGKSSESLNKFKDILKLSMSIRKGLGTDMNYLFHNIGVSYSFYDDLSRDSIICGIRPEHDDNLFYKSGEGYVYFYDDTISPGALSSYGSDEYLTKLHTGAIIYESRYNNIKSMFNSNSKIGVSIMNPSDLSDHGTYYLTDYNNLTKFIDSNFYLGNHTVKVNLESILVTTDESRRYEVPSVNSLNHLSLDKLKNTTLWDKFMNSPSVVNSPYKSILDKEVDCSKFTIHIINSASSPPIVDDETGEPIPGTEKTYYTYKLVYKNSLIIPNNLSFNW